MTSPSPTRGLISRHAVVKVPQDVVFRPFVAETVVLNLKTGLYHGLNPVGGRMLEVLAEVGRVSIAAEQLAEEFGQPLETITRDICAFCYDLSERELIQIQQPAI